MGMNWRQSKGQLTNLYHLCDAPIRQSFSDVKGLSRMSIFAYRVLWHRKRFKSDICDAGLMSIVSCWKTMLKQRFLLQSLESSQWSFDSRQLCLTFTCRSHGNEMQKAVTQSRGWAWFQSSFRSQSNEMQKAVAQSRSWAWCLCSFGSQSNEMQKAIRKFRINIIKGQRVIRDFLACKNGRRHLLSLQWDLVSACLICKVKRCRKLWNRKGSKSEGKRLSRRYLITKCDDDGDNASQ